MTLQATHVPDTQRRRFRAATQSVHRVLGLAAGLLIILIGLTGSILVYRDEIDGLIYPGIYAADTMRVHIDADRAAAIAREADPGSVTGVEIPHPSGNPRTNTYNVFVTRGTQNDAVLIDPATGRVRVIFRPHARLTDWLYDLHTALLLAATGRTVVGVAGIAMTLVALSGIVLWPGWKTLRAGFTFKRHASMRRTSYDVHKITGLASLAFFLFLGISGSMMTWAPAVNAGLQRVTQASFDTPAVRLRSHTKLLTLGKLVEAGDRAMPGSIATYVAQPAANLAVYEARIKPGDYDQQFGFRTLYLNPATGALIRDTGGAHDPIPNWYSYLYALHVGNVYFHPLYRVVILIAGLMPLVLAVTGLVVVILKRRHALSFHRRSSRSTAPIVSVALIATAAIATAMSTSAPARADGARAAISGHVTDALGAGIGGARVELLGPAKKAATTDESGAYELAGLPFGIYTLRITKAGFDSASRTDLDLRNAGGLTVESIVLREASFTSLREVGHTAVSRTGTLNTGTAAESDISAQTFADQGRLDVNRVLSQTPGVSTAIPGTYYGNGGFTLTGASPAVPVNNVPQIRGALEYETASLVDGHPLSIGRAGYFDSSFLNPYVLQDLEIVKGPGAIVPNINYAIGGTVNYRTLEPTRRAVQNIDYGVDRYGGQFANFRATGTAGRLGYALDYVLNGTPGPLSNVPSFEQQGIPDCCGGSSTFVNNRLVKSGYACNYSLPSPQPQYINVYNPSCPSVLVGLPLASFSFEKSELLKFKYDLSQSTSITTSYLAGQSLFSAGGSQAYFNSFVTFAPPAGYTGPLFDAAQCCGAAYNAVGEDNQGLFSTELRTTLGGTTILARYYEASRYNFVHEGPGPGSESTYAGDLYGGVTFDGDTSPTVFDGQRVTVKALDAYLGFLDKDRLGGVSLELDRNVGNALLTIAYDQTHSDTFSVFNSNGYNPILVPSGSGQTLRTLLARGEFALSPQFSATLSNYLITDVNRASTDGGVSFDRSVSSFDTPRLGFVWRPEPATSFRAGLGGSLAPPYLYLLTTPTGTPQANQTPATSFTQVLSNADLKPETAFGYDIGIDHRFRNGTILSSDVYRTNLRNQFLTKTTAAGTYTGKDDAGQTVTLPLFLQQTGNLGHSRYEGLELSARRNPQIGFGYVLQGALTRAYAYDLPTGFYDTPAGPNTANLGITANANFNQSGAGYNGLSASRVPYASGYGELNYRRSGNYAALGLTYYGNNNVYDSAPFFVLNGTLRFALPYRSYLQLSADNLTGVLDKPYDRLDGGIPVPLHNGQLGQTEAIQYGPTTFRAFIHAEIGPAPPTAPAVSPETSH